MGIFPVRTRLRAIIIAISAVVLSFVTASGAWAVEEVENTEKFRYHSWDLDYQVSLDSEGRAQAEVTETLEAKFPETDQNRGIIRSLPLRYQGAPAAPQDIRVTDDAGNDVPFEVENDDGLRNILIGDDAFVHGDQTYVIDYTVDDVMHATDQADEFYWDLVPVDRMQAIDEVTAQISLDSALSSALTGSSACYLGSPDDTQPCSLEPGANNSGFTVSASELGSGQGITVAIGVEPGTVTQPPERQDNVLLDVVPVVLTGIAVLLASGAAVAVWRMVRRYRDDTSKQHTEYGIPQAMNPLLAKWISGGGDNPLVATILDLAVRGVLRIEQAEDQKPSKKKSEPKLLLRLLDAKLATDPLETDLLEGLFPGLAPGTTFDFPKDSKTFTKAVEKVMQDSGKAVIDRGYQRKVRHRGAAIAGWVSLVLLVPVTVLLIMGASRDNTVTTVLSVVLGLLGIALVFIAVCKHRVLTPKGAATRRQLEQLRQTIKASETDRFAMLQSVRHNTGPTTALYDRLLPYAVLFGLQDDWSEVLADVYQQHQILSPVWYPALLHHGTDSLQSSLDTMLAAVSSAATTSSAGAGATGGGVAGGGGGGGAAGGR